MPTSIPMTPEQVRRAEQVRQFVRNGSLRAVRNRTGLSREALARLLDVPTATLTSWERLGLAPQPATALRIAGQIEDLAELAAEATATAAS